MRVHSGHLHSHTLSDEFPDLISVYTTTSDESGLTAVEGDLVGEKNLSLDFYPGCIMALLLFSG